jgi:transcriptional regulator with XRE-family HTH domain
MNLVLALRRKIGLTQGMLARMAGTSQSTIAAYESDAKSPTIRTLRNLAASQGLQMQVSFVPVLTREDRRSLAFHQAIVDVINRNPQAALEKARSNLLKLRHQHPNAAVLLDRWAVWLSLPPGELIEEILSLSPMAREMRQVSPFSGLLSAAQRARILRDFRQEETA